MAIITINGYGDVDLLDKFVKDWNESERTAQKRKDIFIDSPGGEIPVFSQIYSMIESCPSKCSLTAVSEIHSAAFELFFTVTCNRSLMPFTFGMYHLGYNEITVNENGEVKHEYDKALSDNLRLMKPYTLSICKKVGMSAKEIKWITSGKDVYFQHDRLLVFLNKVDGK